MLCVARQRPLQLRQYASSSNSLSTMQLIKKLREEVQAPLNIVKSAVTQAQPVGNYDSALAFLKKEMTKRGERLVAKSTDRSATEGWVIATRTVDGKSASLSVFNCETDFVAKSDKVVELASEIGSAFISKPLVNVAEDTHSVLSLAQVEELPISNMSLKEKLTESMSLFGESMRMSRASVTRIVSAGTKIGIHCHGGPSISKDVYVGRLGAMVNIHSPSRDLSEIADELAREIVAQNPISADELWTLEKVGDAQNRTVRDWAGSDVEITAWTRMERTT